MTRKTKFGVDGLPPNHLMTHLPKSNQCDTCLRAKLYEAPHRRRENQRDVLKDARSREDPKGPMERVAVDFVIAQDLVSQTGEKVALGHSSNSCMRTNDRFISTRHRQTRLWWQRLLKG